MPEPNPPFSSSLSELEGGVLGIVLAKPGSTAHSVREEFRQSRSSHWSGSAGAIYPLMKKLLERGLISATDTKRGSRVRRAYTITAAGTKALKEWIGPPLPEWVAAVTFDPLRTRMPYIHVLSRPRQEKLLEEAERLLELELEDIRRVRREARDTASFWDQATCEGTQLVTQARLKWIRKVLGQLRSS